jgi:hypothetical protein
MKLGKIEIAREVIVQRSLAQSADAFVKRAPRSVGQVLDRATVCELYRRLRIVSDSSGNSAISAKFVYANKECFG